MNFIKFVILKNNNNFTNNLTERKLLRKQLNCNSFKWYLNNVISQKFIPDENVKAYGLVKFFLNLKNVMLNFYLDNVKINKKFLCKIIIK